MAEFTLNTGDGQTYYDISLVDGYNIPMAIVWQTGGNASLEEIPPNLTNPSCVGTAGGQLADQGYNPYESATQSFLSTNSTYPLPFDQKVDASTVANWCPWDLQVNKPNPPGNGVYMYPDNNIQRPIFDPCYSACAKYNDPQDCCTNEWNSPTKCQPSAYSKSAKKVCPDAYSFGASIKTLKCSSYFLLTDVTSIRRSDFDLHHSQWRRFRSDILSWRAFYDDPNK